MNNQTSRDKKKELHFGIMCNGYSFKKWQADAIKTLTDSKDIKLRLLILNDNPSANPESFIKKITNYPFKNLLYRIYKRFFFKPDAEKIVDMSGNLKSFNCIKCQTIKRGKYSEYFSEEDLQIIKDNNLDFILRFGFNIIRGEILNIAKYGVWSFHHDDEDKYRGGPPGFWEIYYNDNVNAVILQKLTDKLDAGIVLKKGFFKTIKHSYSANVDNIFNISLTWIKNICNEIQNGVASNFNNNSCEAKAKIYSYPKNRQMFIFLYRLWCNKFKFHYKELFRAEQWNIGVINKNISSLLTDESYEINWLPKQARNIFRADPFGYIENDELNILYEDFDYKTRLGRIGKYQVSSIKYQEEIIKNNCHLAYPYIFRINDEVYCVPETSSCKKINIYKLSKEWVFVQTLIDNIDAVDSTVFFHEGLWWLFCTRKEYDTNTNLFAYYSDKFDGEYKEHLNNPVKTDISSARPAGTPFIHKGNLYRPSQDCSAEYGASVKINKVIKLNSCEFEEITIKIIKPDRGSLYKSGIHTISSAGDYTIVDGKRMIFVWQSFTYQLKRKIKKVILKTKD